MTYKEDCRSTVTVEIESPSISTDRVSDRNVCGGEMVTTSKENDNSIGKVRDIVSHRTVQGTIYSVKNVENVYDNVNEKIVCSSEHIANVLVAVDKVDCISTSSSKSKRLDQKVTNNVTCSDAFVTKTCIEISKEDIKNKGYQKLFFSQIKMMPYNEDTGIQEAKKNFGDQDNRKADIRKQPSTPTRRKTQQNKDEKKSILKLTPKISLKQGGRCLKSVSLKKNIPKVKTIVEMFENLKGGKAVNGENIAKNGKIKIPFPVKKTTSADDDLEVKIIERNKVSKKIKEKTSQNNIRNYFAKSDKISVNHGHASVMSQNHHPTKKGRHTQASHPDQNCWPRRLACAMRACVRHA